MNQARNQAAMVTISQEARDQAGAAQGPRLMDVEGLASLPEDLLQRALMGVSAGTGGLSHVLVCRRWRDLSAECQLALRVQRGAMVGVQEVLDSVHSFPNLTALHLPRGTFELLLTDLLGEISAAVGGRLRHLSIGDDMKWGLCLLEQDTQLRQLCDSCQNLKILQLPRYMGCYGLPPGLLNMSSSLEALVLCPLTWANRKDPDVWTERAKYRRDLPPSVDPSIVPASPIANLRLLKTLRLRSTEVRVLPSAFSRLESLTDLTLDFLQLQGLPEGFGNLRSLRTLIVRSEDKDFEELPTCFPGLSSLRRLLLRVEWLRCLPPDLGCLRRLRCLEVQTRCGLLLPASLSDLARLSRLEAPSSCFSTPVLPLAETLLQLRELHVSGIGMVELPEGLCLVPRLRHLHISKSWLSAMPASLGSLTSLEKLELKECHLLEELPPPLTSLSALRQLAIGSCNRLTGLLEDGLGSLRQLTQLELVDLCHFTRLPLSLGNLTALEDLYLDDLPDLTALEEEHLSGLTRLRKLRMHGLRQVARLPDSLGCLRQLSLLELFSCPMLTQMPVCASELICLQRLRLHGLCISTVDFIEGCSALKELSINSCPQLCRLPESLGQLEQVKVLEVIWCWDFEQLPLSTTRLTALTVLKLERLLKLRSLPEELGALRSLRELRVINCALEGIPASLGQLSSLVYLAVVDCLRLKEIPSTIAQLSSLEGLFLTRPYDPFPDFLTSLQWLKLLVLLQQAEGWPNLRALRAYQKGTPNLLRRLKQRLERLAEEETCQNGEEVWH